jgi:hypothetical protein
MFISGLALKVGTEILLVFSKTSPGLDKKINSLIV